MGNDRDNVPTRMNDSIEVDVIIPVHNAAATIEEAIESVLNQTRCNDDQGADSEPNIMVYICCFDDASEDESWSILENIQRNHQQRKRSACCFETHICMQRGNPPSRGAGYARNRAVEMRTSSSNAVLCWLDSDDIMQSTRIMEQTSKLLKLPESALVGTCIDRIPADATRHYTQWINALTDERLMLERFRELTVIQPTWMMRRSHFDAIGGYIEAPLVDAEGDTSWSDDWYKKQSDKRLTLSNGIETPSTLRVAEDLRFFHEHLAAGGSLHLIRKRLVVYRHREGESQSSKTPRKLLAQLRTLALERSILTQWDQFVVWGAGRDGKDFIKSLNHRAKVYCIVDVDDTKIARGFYETREWKIPVVHFSALAPDAELYNDWKTCRRPVGAFAKIVKHRDDQSDQEEPEAHHTAKKAKVDPKKDPGMSLLDPQLLRSLPVIVCVAMYRSNGALEHNVSLIGRTEGVDLFHFS